MPVTQPNGGPNTQAMQILQQVKVPQFTASPSTIGPFEYSVISWMATGPSLGWNLTLNGEFVDRAGSRVVQPVESSYYSLSAVAGQVTRPLGKIFVTVNLDACDIIVGPDDEAHQIASFVKGITLSHDPSLYFRSEPTVTFQPGLIHIDVSLGMPVAWFPDPTIDGTLEFGLGVVNGQLVCLNPTVTASISEPWYVYLGGIAFLGLWISLDDGQIKAKVSFEELAQGLPQAIAVQYPRKQGYKYQNVAIVPAAKDNPIQITECPIPPSRPVPSPPIV
jgi:hypothetical protein